LEIWPQNFITDYSCHRQYFQYFHNTQAYISWSWSGVEHRRKTDKQWQKVCQAYNYRLLFPQLANGLFVTCLALHCCWCSNT